MSADQPATPTPPSHVLSAEDLYDLTTYPFTVTNGPGGRPCVFLMRRLDMMTQLLEEIVPTPLLQAALVIFDEIREWAAKQGESASFESVFRQLDAKKKQTVLAQLRAYACNAVLQPRIVPADQVAAPGEFPVTLLSADLLFALWNHVPPQATVRRLDEPAARDFRRAPEGAAVEPPSPGHGVRPATVDLGAQPVAAGQP